MGYTLAYKDRYKRVLESLIESDTSNSIAFASLPDNEPTKLVAEWTGKQYTKLLSALYTGANLMFPEEANEIIWQLIKVVHQPITLEDEEDNCINFPPSAPFVSFIPQNPYNEPNFVPDGYLQPPFLVNTALGYPEFFGYLATDVMVSPDSLPILGGWDDLIFLNFPTIKLTVRGVGQIELDLLSVTIGGYAIIKLGSPPTIADIIDGVIETGVTIVDLNQDAIAIPIESDIVIAEEIDIDAPLGIDVYIVFVPKIDDSLSLFTFGGGIRKIGLCGLEEMGVIMGIEDIRFNAETCSLEQRELGVWSTVENWDEIWACIGGMMATQEEIKQAVIDAAETLAAQMLSGQAGNTSGAITISPDGSIAIGGGGTAIDDPLTEINELNASRYGGVLEIAAKLELLLDKVDTYYGATNGTFLTALEATQAQIKSYFACDAAAMDTAISAYYDYRVQNNRLLFDRAISFPQYLYCNGYDINALGRWVIDVSAFGYSKGQVVLGLWGALSEGFYSHYYELGAVKLSNGYLDAACVPIAPQTLDNMVFGVSRTTTPFKASHRMKFTIEGYVTDAQGDIQDAFWYRTSEGDLSRSNPTFVHSAGNNQPSDNQVVYNSAHKYEYTIDLQALNQVMVITMNKNGGIDPSGLITNVPFKITIEDLGLSISQ